jgi:regulator of sigma E protease
VRSPDELRDAAKEAQVLISVLPDSEHTRGLVDADVLDALGRGVFVNVVLGMVIISGLIFSQGESYIPTQAINENGGVYVNEVGRSWGLETGDEIIKINGEVHDNLMGALFNPDFLSSSKKELTILRNGQVQVVKLPVNLENSLSVKSDLPLIAPRYQFEVNRVVGGSPADKAGLVAGDKFLSVDSVTFGSFFEFKELLQKKSGRTSIFWVQSKAGELRKTYISISNDGTIGFMPEIGGFKNAEKRITYTLLQSAGMGIHKSYELIAANAKGLSKVVSGKVNAKNSLAGPIGIAQMYGPVWDWINFWTLTATLSLALALMNILPIPALDGGHVMFLLYEMITRRPVNEKVLYIGQLIGMAVLLSLFVFIFWVDISRALGF